MKATRLKKSMQRKKRSIQKDDGLRVAEPPATYGSGGGHTFGGDWTQQKLERIRKYLSAYTTALKNQPFTLAYIDAFAGTGYRTTRALDSDDEFPFPELAEEDSRRFVEGSARIALQVVPRFSKYIFIERKGKHIPELERLKEDFHEVANDITIENAEANEYLIKLSARDWSKHRAVLFLDPYGMQVKWATLQAIARTRAIDLWILFPLGVAVNRLLKRDGKINQGIKRRLDEMFGTQDWYHAFYKEVTTEDLFGEKAELRKVSTFKTIGGYFVQRLKTTFPGVAENPRPLFNSKGNPLYLLCFAASNERGAKPALRIAQHILKS
jgi:three-Cys-motif partner protein